MPPLPGHDLPLSGCFTIATEKKLRQLPILSLLTQEGTVAGQESKITLDSVWGWPCCTFDRKAVLLAPAFFSLYDRQMAICALRVQAQGDPLGVNKQQNIGTPRAQYPRALVLALGYCPRLYHWEGRYLSPSKAKTLSAPVTEASSVL